MVHVKDETKKLLGLIFKGGYQMPETQTLIWSPLFESHRCRGIEIEKFDCINSRLIHDDNPDTQEVTPISIVHTVGDQHTGEILGNKA